VRPKPNPDWLAAGGALFSLGYKLSLSRRSRIAVAARVGSGIRTRGRGRVRWAVVVSEPAGSVVVGVDPGCAFSLVLAVRERAELSDALRR
jgi:hypothetical protein